MVNFIKGFTINLAKSTKTIKSSTNKKVGGIAEGVVFKDEESNEFKVKVTFKNPTENTPKDLVCPLTPESYNLKDKCYVFSKEKDKYNHYVCYIREKNVAKFFPGSDDKYVSIISGIVISGNVLKIDGKLYFDYIDFVAFSEQAKEAANNLNFDY